MAASMDWRQVLNQHKIFQQLQSCLGKVRAEVESKNILAIHDGEIFVWNAYNSTILTTNLKLLVGKSEAELSEATFQVLLCGSPPTFEVESLQISESGSYLAVVGKRGVTVLELPQRWGKHAAFEGGKHRILCRAYPLAERFFLSSKEQLLQLSWHPGSDNEMVLVLLFSDNTLRLYNLENPQCAEQTHHLDYQSTRDIGIVSPTRLRVHDALGESAVSFDCGPAFEQQNEKPVGRGNERSVELGPSSVQRFVWPVYILWGNGDVYVLKTSLRKTNLSSNQTSSPLRGPLSMYPAAEDNYGTEACYISVLYTQPPTVVIATAEGKLHHCVLLTEAAGEPDDTLSEVSYTSASHLNGDDTTASAGREFLTQRLYVYETVELELSLTTVALENDSFQEDFNCPIRIYKDGSCADRYHCSHSAGVHTVALPWQQKISQYCDQENKAQPPSLAESEHAIVEHLICTKPLPSSPCCPILGLCVIADRLLGSNLLCLTNVYECVIVPIVASYKQHAPALLSVMPSQGSLSPIRKLHSQREPFNSHINKILQRSASNPILKTSASTDLDPEKCLQLLSRATQVFREEYLQKQDLAREEIHKRVRILREHKEQQLSDLHGLQTCRAKLTEHAQELAEKYEEAKYAHEKIVQRTEIVLRKLQLRLPVLTEAEKNMHAELKDLDENIKGFKTKIEQLNAKRVYQEREVSMESKRGVSSSAGFTKSQSQNLRTVLTQEGEDISTLVRQVNQLKLSLDV